MRFERKKMVNWYDPEQLAYTATKTVISGIFGNFADRREMQAALDPKLEPHDLSDKSEVWIDYISDLGDGFDATYTMAHLMAQNQLVGNGEVLSRGDILIMGGDQVYPTPELEEYDNRLKGPYNAAYPWVENDSQRPSLFALPGNHDWYDGLTNFLRLFCQGRSLGNWHSKQRRSYFAIKLPHDTWLLGIDVQLNADIDYPQLCYFKEIARDLFKEDDKIILCTAEPSWVYQSMDTKNNSHQRINFFINRILYDRREDKYDRIPADSYFEKNKTIQILTILTGDFHHYSRYELVNSEGQFCQLITAGGGGAFMHPTHPLKQSITPSEESSAELKSVFPPKDASRRLTWRNLLFPIYSIKMALFLGAYHLFTVWLLQVGSRVGGSFLETLGTLAWEEHGWKDLANHVWDNVRFNPGVLALNLILFLGIFFFTDTKSGRGKWNYFAGGTHALLQIVSFYVLCWLFAQLNFNYWNMDLESFGPIVLFSLEMIVVGGGISGMLFGLYLLISISLLNSHMTEASSSFRWEGYKNFLRIQLTADGLKIYPIGVKRVVKNWKNIGSEENPTFEGGPIDYQLIEGPIVIPYTKHAVNELNAGKSSNLTPHENTIENSKP